MNTIFLTLILVIVFASGSFLLKSNKLETNKKYGIVIIIFVSLIIEVMIALLYPGFTPDLDIIMSWAKRIYTYGPSEFYSPEVAMPYPPLYLYTLYFLQLIKETVPPNTLTQTYLLYKFPAIVFDILTTFLIYKAAERKLDDKKALILTSLYILNPAIFIDSCIWGQTDSVFTFFIVLMCICLMEHKIIPAGISLGAALLMKQQSLAFVPVFICGLLFELERNKKDLKFIGKTMIAGTVTAIMMLILCIPFGIKTMLEQYLNTLDNYRAVSLNAFNIWSLLRLENESLFSTIIFELTYQNIGTIIFIAIAIFLLLNFFDKRKESELNFALQAATAIALVFTFSTAMHERYLFAAVPLVLVSYIYNPQKKLWILYWVFSFCSCVNISEALAWLTGNTSFSYDIIKIIISGIVTVATFSLSVTYMNQFPIPRKEEITEVDKQ